MDQKKYASKIINAESFARDQSIVMDWERQTYKLYNRKASIFQYSKNQLLNILKIAIKIPQLRRVSYQVQERIKFLILGQQILALKQSIQVFTYQATSNSKSKKTLPKNTSKSQKQIEHKNAQLPAKTSTWFKLLRWIAPTLIILLSIIRRVELIVSTQQNGIKWEILIVITAIIQEVLEIINKFWQKKYKTLSKTEEELTRQYFKEFQFSAQFFYYQKQLNMMDNAVLSTLQEVLYIFSNNSIINQIINFYLYQKPKSIQKMIQENRSSSSLGTFSIKLTQNNIPSNTAIKTNQENISLTYTVSLQNISQQIYSFRNLQQPQQNPNQVSIENIKQKKQKTLPQPPNIFKQTFNPFNKEVSTRLQNLQNIIEKEKDVFRKKSILKISNIDFSSVFTDNGKENHYLGTASPEPSISKGFTNKRNNKSFISKNIHMNNDHQILIQSKKHSAEKWLSSNQSTEQYFAEDLLLKTNKFHSIKQDKIIEPLPLRKKSISLRREPNMKNKQLQTHSTQRKSVQTKLPFIKGSINRNIGLCNSVTTRKKSFTTSHQNIESFDRKYTNTLNQKILLGKSCKINQNDDKAKKYLKKIILNRQSIMHFTNDLKNLMKTEKQYKQNIEDIYIY